MIKLSKTDIRLSDDTFVEAILDEVNLPKNKQRKEDAWKAYRSMTGGQRPYVADRLAELYPDTHQKFRVGDISLAKKVDGKLSKAYKQPPIRDLGTKSQTKAYEAIQKAGEFAEAFKDGDSIFNLHKYVLFWVSYINGEDGEDGTYKLRALPPYLYDIVRDKTTGEVILFILHYPNNEITGTTKYSNNSDEMITDSQADTAADTETYAIWSATEHRVVTKGVRRETVKGKIVESPIFNSTTTNEDGVNPFAPYVPVTFVSSSSATDYPTPNNITDQSIEWNVDFSDLKTASKAQGHGQLVVKRVADKKKSTIFMGLHTAIDIILPKRSDSPQPDVSYINASPDLAGQLEVLKFDAINILDERGIKGGGTISGGIEKFSSGLDRYLSTADVQDVIESNQSRYTKAENDIYRIVKQGEDNQENTTFTAEELAVVYQKPTIMISDSETLDNIEKQIELGLIEEWEKYIIMDPNLGETKAKAKLKRVEDAKLLKQKDAIDTFNNETKEGEDVIDNENGEEGDKDKNKPDSGDKDLLQKEERE